MGLVIQQDHGLWQQQTGGPSDPQPGNIPGGRRDVLRSRRLQRRHAGTASPSTAASGQVSGGTLSVAAASLGQDAAAVFYLDQYMPMYFEITRPGRWSQKPTGGWKANAYVIFDYFSPTDFKFAGIDVALNKVVLGHRTTRPAGSSTRRRSVQGSVRSDTWYDLLVTVNGLVVTVLINGASQLQAQYDPR